MIVYKGVCLLRSEVGMLTKRLTIYDCLQKRVFAEVRGGHATVTKRLKIYDCLQRRVFAEVRGGYC